MAERQRKRRRVSISPEPPTPAKRSRVTADNVSIRSASHTISYEHPTSRAERSRNIPMHHARPATPLPSDDDWNFRLQVISSTTPLSDDIFDKAVQGLVKICFPHGILEELGVDLLAEHMHKEKAPEGNVTRMRKVFDIEMIRCVSRMLAGYLDTPEKVKHAIRSVVQTSTTLHVNIENQSLNRIIQSPALSAESGTGSAPHTTNASADSNNVPLQDQAFDEDFEEIVDREDAKTTLPPRPPRSIRNSPMNKKVSATWRWDIEGIDASTEDLEKAFRRPVDLFAYHALPIAKGLLATNATKKELRLKIQDMVDDMPADVYEKWVESFDKLKHEDKNMLVRVPPEPERDGRTAATPAPLIGRTQSGILLNSGRRQSIEGAHIKPSSKVDSEPARVKKERQGHDDDNFRCRIVTHQPTKASTDLAEESAPTEEDALGPSMLANPSTRRLGGQLSSSTPVIDLLWGRDTLLNVPRNEVMSRIDINLRKRTSLKSITLTKLDGSCRVTTFNSLLKHMRGAGQIITNNNKVRNKLEELLRPWVVADTSGFPELAIEPFIFADMMQLVTPVLDILCSAQTTMAHSAEEVELEISTALYDRKVEAVSLLQPGVVSLSSHVKSCVTNSTTSEIVKRRSIEKYLRRIAFRNRDKFPELKKSQLVQFWKQCTGAKW